MDSKKIEKLNERIALAHLGGGQHRIDKQHAKKKLTARERIEYLMDEGSFEEIGILVTHRTTDFGMDKEIYFGDGVVTGYGTINGRVVYVYAQDFIATSGTTYNKISNKSQNQSRGLTELMKLEPIMYREDARNIGSRISTTEERDIRLGFTTNNLLTAIPEAVKTSDWVTLKEGQDPVKMTIENPTGIMYNQIIPVTVKAIQEQQAQIEELRAMILELKTENEKLKNKK